MTDTPGGMPPPPIRLLIELDPCAEPIAGTLRQQPGGVSTPFHGWLGLTQALESIRHPSRQPAGHGYHPGAGADPRTDH